MAAAEMGKAGGMSKVIAAAEAADRIGVADRGNVGVAMGTAAADEIRRIQNLSRLPMGITELDGYLDGGLAKAALGCVIGGAGDGKSIFLIQAAAAALRCGKDVAIATLELPESMQHVRLLSNLTGLPINQILDGGVDHAMLVWESTMAEVEHRHGRRPHLHVREFAAYSTHVGDILAWVSEVEDHTGCPVELVVTDYADKIGAKQRARKETSDYDTGREVYEALRKDAVDRGRWHWTAAQSKRRADGKRKTKDLDDVADSMHKIRIADLVITLNVEEDDQGMRQISYFVAKHRVGDSRRSIGPYPVDYATGRVGG